MPNAAASTVCEAECLQYEKLKVNSLDAGVGK